MATGIELLSAYSGNESGTEEDETPIATKRIKLPLPSVLKVEKTPEVVDDPLLHNGRKRSYAHERGNWNSHIYIAYQQRETFEVFCDQIIETFLPDLEVVKIDTPHISLSKTFVLYYHWIKEFYTSLKQRLTVIPSYDLNFNGIKVYCNEDLSRTFIALTVGSGTNDLSSSIKLIDDSLKEYKLPVYYEEASFHMSFAWCLGDNKEAISKKMIDLTKIFQIFKESTDFSFVVRKYLFKTGFKEFQINLG